MRDEILHSVAQKQAFMFSPFTVDCRSQEVGLTKKVTLILKNINQFYLKNNLKLKNRPSFFSPNYSLYVSMSKYSPLRSNHHPNFFTNYCLCLAFGFATC